MKRIYILLFLLFTAGIFAQNNTDEKVVFLSADHNGVFNSMPVNSHPYLKFMYRTNGPVRSSPCIYNGKLVFGSGDGNVYCLNPETGEEYWKYNTGAAVNSSPDIYNDKVYLTNREESLFCLNLSDGKLLWKFFLGKELPYKWAFDYYLSSPAVFEGVVYTGSGDGNLYAVDAFSGKMKWKFEAGSRVHCKPLIIKGAAIFGDFSGRLYAIEIKTQKKKWVFESDGSKLNLDDYGFDRAAFVSSPTYADNKIFIGSRDGFLYALDFDSGNLVWKFDDKVSWIISSPAIHDGRVFTGTSDGKFINAVSIDSGKELWRKGTDNLVWSSAAVAGNVLYYGDYSGNIFTVNQNNGDILWKFKTADIIHASPVVYKQTVYIGSDDGCLYAVTGSTQNSDVREKAKKVVYWENITASKWPSDKVTDFVRDYFKDEGYVVVDSNSLKQFLTDRINDHLPSVVLLIKNFVPMNVYSDSLNTDLVREYLNSGGKLVMLSPNPFAFKYNRKSLKLEDINFQIPSKMFDIKYAGVLTDAIRGWYPAYPTEEGEKFGLRGFWLSTSQVKPSSGLKVLARDETGYASAWIKSYGGNDGTGLLQFWVDRNSPNNLFNVYNLTEWGLQ